MLEELELDVAYAEVEASVQASGFSVMSSIELGR
jgi:hypothetical protein